MDNLWNQELDARAFLMAYAFGLKSLNMAIPLIKDIENAVGAINELLGISKFSYRIKPEEVTYKVVRTPNPRTVMVYMTPEHKFFRDATASVALSLDDQGWILDVQSSTIYVMKREEVS